MRGTVPGLASPHPIGATLPGLYADDSFAQQLCQGLDEVLAPVLATLDCLPAYLDPRTAPPDMLGWLAGWVAMTIDPAWPEARRRQLVAMAAQLYMSRGTSPALTRIIELTTGNAPQLVESGGSGWSQEPDGSLPGRPEPDLIIRLQGTEPHLAALSALIGAFVPAHVPWRVELPSGSGPARP
jgi:phage tail-like protein